MKVLLKAALAKQGLLMLTLVALALRPATAGAQALRSDWESRAYQFVGDFFGAKAKAESQSYRLRVAILPVVSPYADNFDLSKTLNNNFLNTHQFITTLNTDSLLSPADFEAMHQQLTAWQAVGKWRVRSLRAQHINLLIQDRRSDAERLFPKFTTYQVFPPLFSVDGQTAFFYVENFCGVECAGGNIHLLRRQPGGSWKRLLVVSVFMS